MTRQQKYPNHKNFTYYNRNPKGRITTDCVVRAMSTALSVPYEKVVMDMAKIQCESGLDDAEPKSIEKYLTANGWLKNRQPKHENGTKFTCKEFVKAHPKGKYILSLAHHLTYLEDGKIFDIWDCYKHGGCVGNYYTEG